jgi:hypothetical protein
MKITGNIIRYNGRNEELTKKRKGQRERERKNGKKKGRKKNM